MVMDSRRDGRNTFRPRKTATLVAQRIVNEIAGQNLQPGTPLPHERVMLDDYGVARGTLREALRFLEMQGVITIKPGPGGGPMVARPTSRHLGSIIAMMLQLEHTSFRSVLEARVTLEPNLARLAAERIDDQQVEELHQSVMRMRQHLDDVEYFLTENERFHALVASAAGNPLFAMITSSLSWITDATALGVEYPPESRQAVAKEHARIHRAIAARDPDRAAAAMAVHMGDFVAYVQRNYPRVLDAPLRWDQLNA